MLRANQPSFWEVACHCRGLDLCTMGKTEREPWNVVENSRALTGSWGSCKRKVMGKKYNLSIVRHKNSLRDYIMDGPWPSRVWNTSNNVEEHLLSRHQCSEINELLYYSQGFERHVVSNQNPI